MDYTISKESNTASARIIGPITESDGNSLKRAFEELLNSQMSVVRIDLTSVPTITSTGLGKLIVLYRRLQSLKRELVITGIHDNLYSMFTSIKLDKMLKIQK